MNKNQKSEEQLKTEIFNIFTQCRNEVSSDRRQVYSGQLCDLIFQWCNNYPFHNINAKEIGLEIFKLSLQLVKKNSKSNILKEENGFFQYLRKALYHAKAEYHRTYESGSIKIPKGKMSKFKKMDEFIRMEECNLGRGLSNDESVQCLSEWLNISQNEARNYLELKKMKNIIGVSFNSYNNDTAKDIFESDKAKIPYMKNTGISPEEELFFSINTTDNIKIIRDSIELILKDTQDRTRDCYRALLTGFFINNSIDLDGLSSVLDTEILEEFKKNQKTPSQHEIYLKYHPDVKKDSAGVRATEMLKKLLKDLGSALKDKTTGNF